MSGAKSATPARTRRTPEEARANILAAAIRLFAERGPDAVGLKDVAEEAGVSHALVTHYFGTYDALVDEAIASHVRRGRAAFFERLAHTKDDDVGAWLAALFQVTSDPLYARVAAWGSLSRRLDDEDLFPRREQGLRLVVDALVARYGARGFELQREDVELFLVVVITSAIGHAILGPAIWGALGYEATPARGAAYRAKVVSLAKGELETELRRARRRRGRRDR
jgi:TetR/AcrR family transcriptional regulator, repressor for neighboring sulfatase